MSLSEMFIKVIGLILAVVGLALILSSVGVSTFVALAPFYVGLIVGVCLLGAGIYIIRGGSVTL